MNVILRVWDDETPAHLWPPRKLWRRAEAALKALGIRPPPPEIRVEHGPDGSPRIHFAFSLPRKHLPELLWGIFAADLGITPSLSARLSLAAPELGVLACPYDDRGVDIIGPNAGRLAQLYHQFDGWLLDYDRARMAEMFSSTPDILVAD